MHSSWQAVEYHQLCKQSRVLQVPGWQQLYNRTTRNSSQPIKKGMIMLSLKSVCQSLQVLGRLLCSSESLTLLTCHHCPVIGLA